MDALSLEEQQLVERLHAKYSAGAAGAGPCGSNELVACKGGTTALPSSWESPPANSGADNTRIRKNAGVDSKVCTTCQGMGTYREEYNFRVMDKFCNDCNGKGVRLFKDGVEVKDVDPTPPTHGESISRESKLKADIVRLEGKISSYQAEKKSLEALMEGATEEQQSLQKALLEQIDLQMKRLQEALDKKVNLLNGTD